MSRSQAWRLRTASGFDLDKYTFVDDDHARGWLAQPFLEAALRAILPVLDSKATLDASQVEAADRTARKALAGEKWGEDPDFDLVRDVTAAVREADQHFERVGGSSRHWVRDCFLPILTERGFAVRRLLDAEEEKGEGK